MAILSNDSTTGSRKILNSDNYQYNLSSYSNLIEAILDIGGEDATLYVPRGSWDADGAVVPANVHLVFDRGGMMVGDCEINGSIDSGVWKIFDGVITLPVGSYITAEWFGTNFSEVISNIVVPSNKFILIIYSGLEFGTSSQTINVNTTLKFEEFGYINIKDGQTLTINGGIDAGLIYIFRGDGTVNGTPNIEYSYPEWFGAKANHTRGGPLTYCSSLAIEKAINFFQNVKLSGNNTYGYLVTQSIALPTRKNYNIGHGIISGGHIIVDIPLKGKDDPADCAFTSYEFKYSLSKGTTQSTSRWLFSGILFESNRLPAYFYSCVFDLDHIYNTTVSNCTFYILHTVATTKHTQVGAAYTDGYSQSFSFIENHFFNCTYIVTGTRLINFEFCGNKCEATRNGIHVKTISVGRFLNNLYESAFTCFIKASLGLSTVSIQGNYFEQVNHSSYREQTDADACIIFCGSDSKSVYIASNFAGNYTFFDGEGYENNYLVGVGNISDDSEIVMVANSVGGSLSHTSLIKEINNYSNIKQL